MIKFVRGGVIALVALLMATAVAYAAWQQNQQIAAVENSILGVWYGSIGGGYPSKEHRRNLTISLEGNTPRCVWEELGKKPDFLTCVVEGAKVSLKTGASSTVDMQLVSANLKGSFTSKDGKSYPIEMGRTTASYAVFRKVLGSPVKCAAKGWRDGGTAYLVIRMLNSTNGTVNILGINTDGMTWGGGDRVNRMWVYKDGVLDYAYGQRFRFHLVVGERNLKGSFYDYSAPAASLPEVDYACDGPLDRVTVK